MLAAFLVLFWCGIIFGLRVPHRLSANGVTVITLVVIASLLLPMGWSIYQKYREGLGKINGGALAAAELERLGVRAGDPVARIQHPSGNDAEVERIARVVVVAEVDLRDTEEFRNSPITTQHDLLRIFAMRGIKAVVATSPKLNGLNQSEWTRLGPTQYWVWRPNSQSTTKPLDR